VIETVNSNEVDKINTQEEMWCKIAPEVEVICGKIFETVNVILGAHSKYGFTEINQNINPSIDDILRIVQVIEFVLTTFSSSFDDFTQTRKLENAAQMIWCVKGLVIAIKSGNADDYEAMIEKMRKHAQH
jgi:hypothetical protein